MNALFGQQDWEKVYDKNGVTVYTRTTERSPFKEFRGETILETTPELLKNIVCDVEKAPEWQYRTAEARLFEREGDTIRYFYRAETPSFLKSRVAYLKLEILSGSLPGEIILKINNIDPVEPVPESAIVMPFNEGFWKLTPVEKGKTRVILQMLAEPGGALPAWLANLVVVETPVSMFAKLRERIREAKPE
ncbi:MAG TPA: hypothetical protein PLK12_15375 [Prolixibacteraceae bacterium]|nr:hypothetical protein [Prolixibacteraceae bacterium]